MKYIIETNIEKGAYPYPDPERRGKWSVRIRFEEVAGGQTTECTLTEGSGTAESPAEAADLARRFTRWAIKAYDLFGLDTEVFDGE